MTEEFAFAEQIDPNLAQVLAEIRQYCDTMPPEGALDLIDKCRMVVSVSATGSGWTAARPISEARSMITARRGHTAPLGSR
ncbi:hypothetical protein ACFW6M_15810 [Streptomyces nigra]|uniref:hypothetical protein n=1 Tax=Streptomyces nigra TaxID=1827580 RepID=UPI0036868B24